MSSLVKLDPRKRTPEYSLSDMSYSLKLHGESVLNTLNELWVYDIIIWCDVYDIANGLFPNLAL